MKNILNIIITSTIGFFVYDFIKSVKDKKKIRELEITDKNNPNYKIWIKNVTETFYRSMNKIGTDQELIYELFTILTKESYKDVSVEFGERSYNHSWGYSDPNYPKRDLEDWLISEIGKNKYNSLIKALK